MRVGARIIEVCELLQEIGPLGRKDISELLDNTKSGGKVSSSSAGMYCKRAVDMGLLTVDKSSIKNHYNLYIVRNDWRQRIQSKPKTPTKSKAVGMTKRKTMFSFASSIFQVGA